MATAQLASQLENTQSNFWSLTFQSSAQEESFLESRRLGLIRALVRSSLVVGFLLMVQSTYLVLSFLNGDLSIPGLREVLIHRSSVSAGAVVTTIFTAIYGMGSCHQASTRVIERRAAMLLPILIMVVPQMDYYYVLKLHNVDQAFFMRSDLPQCTIYASDSRLILSWISIMIASHFFLNVRWFMLVPSQLAGVIVYVICAVLGSPEGIFNVPMNLALFSAVTVLASLAKRQLEHHERHQRLQLISERVARFESDFKLEQAQSMSSGVKSPVGRSSPMSRAFDLASQVTDQTGQTGFTQFIFDMKTDTKEQLDAMVILGQQEHWLIEARQLSFNPKSLIGRGNYGVILKGDLLGMPVAVKLPLASASLSLPDLANELRFLRRVRHPHIVAFQGACILPEAEVLFLVEELVEGTSLQALLPGSLVLDSSERHGVLLGVCRALQYLHGLRPSIAHGDLKPTNVLVLSRDNSAKLIDFGLSRIRHKRSRQLGGTPRYMAPEVLTKSAQMAKADKADVFSFGRVIFFVLTAASPLQGLSVQDVVSLAEKNKVPELKWPATPVPFMEQAKDLTEACLLPAPDDRPAAATVVQKLLKWSLDSTAVAAPEDVTVEERVEVDAETRLVTSCAAAAKLYLAQKNQI
mmetsp:Transcript_26954/g.62675  ORF Transcript_26954/g.62675 Transcript_26954/m.62675 type:complete len:637 (-) Transcript_26954:366-2276(-)